MRYFTVEGKPFFSLGGQVHNSSAYTLEEMETAWKAIEVLKGNTLEVPVYWEQVEPVEGQFDFRMVGDLLQSARERSLKLILLWFGTWKNGMMKYCPEWVKLDRKRFRRVISPEGTTLAVLSPHCEETREADKRAFCALVEYLHHHDAEQNTVIALQLQNEPGTLGCDRDYGAEAEALFNGKVPNELLRSIAQHPQSSLSGAWQQAVEPKTGSWSELFGWQAGELFNAWHIAVYIDDLAAAGKAIYSLPMYVNVWLNSNNWRLPGLTYPSGGATPNALDLWKWAAPHIDLIAPDIYDGNHQLYRQLCAAYLRQDNPLFIPESAINDANALNLFYAIADYQAIGYHLFGIENLLHRDGSIRPEAKMLIDSFHCVRELAPLLVDYQGTGRIHAVVQSEFSGEQYFEFQEYLGLVKFLKGDPNVRLDYHHSAAEAKQERGRGLIIEASPTEFYLAGAGYRLMLKKKGAPNVMQSAANASETLMNRLLNYLRVEEGHFESDGRWVADRKRNGDESDFGIWVHPDVGIVHVLLGE